MSLRFTGTYDELKAKLKDLSGQWRDLNPNQRQFRTPDGGVANWYPSTGSLTFQGNSPGVEQLQTAVTAILAGKRPPVQAAATSTTQDENVFAAGNDTAEPDSGPPTLEVLRNDFADSELIIGLVGPVGTELGKVRSILEDWLKKPGYEVCQLRVTQDVIPVIVSVSSDRGSEYDRLNQLMDAGNKARRSAGDNSVLALGIAGRINLLRGGADVLPQPQPPKRKAYIISSLKHPAEVARLREIYPEGFYLIGVHADEKRRFDYLTKDKDISPDKANDLIARDHDEHLDYGQKVAETFHLSDFFVRIDGQDDHLRHSLWRILELLFGNPYITPTFDEYAMFLAFAASLSSADLSRQIGAVVAIDDQVVATGANDCPKANGGRYWPRLNRGSHLVEDQEDGRDFKRGEDSNRAEQQKIIEDIVQRATSAGLPRENTERLRDELEGSRVRDLTEFGRVVHAEMDALLTCSRLRISTAGGKLYTTTFPCHNCAKHIVAAGIRRVVFIEPYQKSKAAEFHTDSIQVGFAEAEPSDDGVIVNFEPFVGVGPRRFFDLFSIRLGSGYPLKRKDKDGRVLQWDAAKARLRLQMVPTSYLRSERVASDLFLDAIRATESDDAARGE
jgi:deoxycytidylate deaminase